MEPIQQHPRVAGIIVHNKRILLIHRFKNGEEYYVFPGGSVEKGESNEEALQRELREELNLETEGYQKIFELNNRGRQETYYLVREFSGEPEIVGLEKERADDMNQYRALWLPIGDIAKSQRLRPEGAIEKVMEFL
jgi:8-oxo-dGTP diphosphatase